MKIYSKTGDKGTTALPSGERVWKDQEQVEAVGTIDELNANVGLLMSLISDETLLRQLHDIQSDLFEMGGKLQVGAGRTAALEHQMDVFSESLPQIHGFVYPEGCRQAAQSHVCRTVCRRAERRFVSLQRVREVAPETLEYLNRLSDYFFLLARKLNIIYNSKEKVW